MEQDSMLAHLDGDHGHATSMPSEAVAIEVVDAR